MQNITITINTTCHTYDPKITADLVSSVLRGLRIHASDITFSVSGEPIRYRLPRERARIVQPTKPDAEPTLPDV